MPMHDDRAWVIQPVATAEELAKLLLCANWCSCQGWSLGGYYFLNDQTSPDGAFEIAIVKPPAEPDGQWWQVETVTFGWLSSSSVLMQHFRETGVRVTPTDLALKYINESLRGENDPGSNGSVAWKVKPCQVETPEQHGSCEHCA